MVKARRKSWRNCLLGAVCFAAGGVYADQFAAVATDRVIGPAKPAEPSLPSPVSKTPPSKQERKAQTQMTWGGAEFWGKNWSVYTGSSASLSASIAENGWRVRLTGGYGSYSYDGVRHIDGRSSATTFDGQSGFGDVLVGYRLQTGDLIVKAFAGIGSVGHSIQPFDPDNAAIGSRYGGSTALEIWFNVSERHWLSLDATYATVFNTYNTTVRSGYRFWPQLSLGLETGIAGNDDYAATRAAGIAAAEFGLFEANDSYVRISAGASAGRDMDLGPYAAVSFALKY